MNILSRIISILIGANIVGITIRALICFAVWFFILPVFFNSLSNTYTLLELLFLSLILLEIIVSKLNINILSSVNLSSNNSSSGHNINTAFIKNLTKLLTKKKCFLLLHTLEIPVKRILNKCHYQNLDLKPLQEKRIQVFKGYNNVIVSFNIHDFKDIVKDENNSLLLKCLVKALNKGFFPSISIIADVDDIINLDQNSLIQDIYYGMYYLNRKLKSRLSLNLVIENMSNIEGFRNFVDITKGSDVFNISYLTDLYKLDAHEQKLSEEFSALQDRLVEKLIGSKTNLINDYQLSYLLIQEIFNLKTLITRLIVSVSTKKPSFFNRTFPVLVSIDFISQQQMEQTASTIK
jgi:hypothetical protein